MISIDRRYYCTALVGYVTLSIMFNIAGMGIVFSSKDPDEDCQISNLIEYCMVSLVVSLLVPVGLLALTQNIDRYRVSYKRFYGFFFSGIVVYLSTCIWGYVELCNKLANLVNSTDCDILLNSKYGTLGYVSLGYETFILVMFIVCVIVFTISDNTRRSRTPDVSLYYNDIDYSDL